MFRLTPNRLPFSRKDCKITFTIIIYTFTLFSLKDKDCNITFTINIYTFTLFSLKLSSYLVVIVVAKSSRRCNIVQIHIFFNFVGCIQIRCRLAYILFHIVLSRVAKRISTFLRAKYLKLANLPQNVVKLAFPN